MKKIKIISLITLTAFIFIITIQNTQLLELKFILFTIKIPRIVLIFLSILFGFTLGSFFSLRKEIIHKIKAKAKAKK